jgi:hypothetical protein
MTNLTPFGAFGGISVPCQIPTISVGEAGAESCGTPGELDCDAAGEVGTSGCEEACAFAQFPLITSSKIIAAAARPACPQNGFPPTCISTSARSVFIAKNPFLRPH